MSKDADLTEVGGRTVVTKATVEDEEVNEGMLVKRYIISERISQETCWLAQQLQLPRIYCTL